MYPQVHLEPCFSVCASHYTLAQALIAYAHIITDAWHTVLNSDPLMDSDEECPDEHLRLDYSGPLMYQLQCLCMLIKALDRRMQVITRLRGRGPTPEPESTQTVPI